MEQITDVHIQYIKKDLTEIKDIIKSNHIETKTKIEACEREIQALKLDQAGSLGKFIQKNSKLIVSVVGILATGGSVAAITEIISLFN